MKKFVLLILSIINMAVMAIFIGISPMDIVPTHYGASGTADQYSSKWTLIFMPCILVVFGIIVAVYYAVTENNADYKNNKKYIDKIITAIFMLFFVLFWVLLIISINGVQFIGSFIPPFLCFMFGFIMIFICNILAKFKQNDTLGIKINATLKSENVWKKTHRLGGYLGVLGGFILIGCGVAGIFLNEIAILLMFIGIGTFLVLECIVTVIYAEVLYRKEKHKRHSLE